MAYTRQPPFGALVAYTIEGAELWRRNFAPDDEISRIRVLSSGGVLVAYQRAKNAVVDRYKLGGDLVWSRSLRSTGPYTFISNIETLRDGRVAIMGSTGDFGAFVSTDTDAVLIVADDTGSDLSTLDIVSMVVGDSAEAPPR